MEESKKEMGPRFRLGLVVTTPGVLALFGENLAAARATLSRLLDRHVSGDWGDLCEEDCEANELALREGLRLLSSYRVGGEKVWIITEGDRSATTFLLPSEY